MKPTTVVSVVAAAILFSNCGEETALRNQAQASVNLLVKGIVNRDTNLLKSVLSTRELERISSINQDMDAGLIKEYETQRSGLILNFGEEWLRNNEIRVLEVHPEGDLVVASLEINGIRSSKPLFFSNEAGALRFIGLAPSTSTARNSVTSAVVGQENWNHWHFHNWGDHRVSAGCGLSNANQTYKGDMNKDGDMNPVNCWSNILTGGWHVTIVELSGAGTSFAGACVYQIIGVDAFIGSDNLMHCTPPL